MTVTSAVQPTRTSGDEHHGQRALLLEAIDPCAGNRLRDAGWEVQTYSHALDRNRLTDHLHGVNVLGIRSGTRTEAVGAFCIGTNQVDLAAAAQRGIAVFNAPFSSTRSVVELAVAEIIALTRKLTAGDHNLHEGQWRKTSAGTHGVRGRCLGIVGYGNIGSQLSVLAESLGMRVLFFDIADKLPPWNRSTVQLVGGTARPGRHSHRARGQACRQRWTVQRVEVRPDA